MNTRISSEDDITPFEEWFERYTKLSGDMHADERKNDLRRLFEMGTTPGQAFDIVTGRIYMKF